LHGVFALMVALRERERTGRGQWIELAQVESLIPFVGDAIVDFQFTGKVPAARGNRHREHAPHGIYKCAGDDSWIALACETDEHWRNLAAALGIDDKRFATASERKANEDALDAELSRSIAQLSADDCIERLREAGVLAAPVNPASAVMADPQIQSREYFVAIDRAVVGTHLYPGAVARLPDTPLRADTPAPLLGEHNRQVFAETLGMTDDEISELERSGVIGSSPRQYRVAS
jgi:crotonobetainyl-CoA:carnitine CoA-transferase CaiB-like acyl-CoA transferase